MATITRACAPEPAHDPRRRRRPLTLARLRASLVYRLGAVPRGEALTETYVDPALAGVDSDIAHLTATVLRRLAAQDEEIAEGREERARLRAEVDTLRALAQTLRRAGDAVADAAEGVTPPGEPPGA